MEDDHESRSLSPSPSASPSPTTPRDAISATTPAAVGRNSVTVAAAPNHQPPLAVALPIQNLRPAAASGREDSWSEGATAALIDAWSERFLELSRGSLKQKHWQEVADAVSSRDDYTKPPKSDAQCKNRIDTLKKKFKTEKTKVSSSPSYTPTWPFFNRLDPLLGPIYNPSLPSAPKPLRSLPPAAAKFAQKRRTPGARKRKALPPSAFVNEDDDVKREVEGVGESSESLPPRTWGGVKRRRAEGLRELAMAVLRFGELYERLERSRMEMAEEAERRRMLFAKEMEMQRMQFFAKARMEITQLMKQHRCGGTGAAVGSGGDELRRSNNNYRLLHENYNDGSNINNGGNIINNYLHQNYNGGSIINNGSDSIDC